MWVVKKTDRFMNIFPKYFWITVVLNVSLQFSFYFLLLTDPSAGKQPFSSAASKEELPGTIMSNEVKMVPDIHEIYNFEQLLFKMSHFNSHSISFCLQTRQQGNSSLALRPITRSYQVLLYPIQQKWYQTYSRFIILNNCCLKCLTSIFILFCLTHRPVSKETAL